MVCSERSQVLFWNQFPFFFSVVLWYSHLESLESNLNSWLYFVCAEFSSFPASALSCPVFCLNIPSNEEKNPSFSLLWWPLKKLFKNKSPSSCVPPLPLNLLKEVTSITKWSFLFFPTIILPPAFLLYCIVWPVVLICLFCLFFTVLSQSLTLLALPCCALYLSVLYLLIIWIALTGSWPYSYIIDLNSSYHLSFLYYLFCAQPALL